MLALLCCSRCPHGSVEFSRMARTHGEDTVFFFYLCFFVCFLSSRSQYRFMWCGVRTESRWIQPMISQPNGASAFHLTRVSKLISLPVRRFRYTKKSQNMGQIAIAIVIQKQAWPTLYPQQLSDSLENHTLLLGERIHFCQVRFHLN